MLHRWYELEAAKQSADGGPANPLAEERLLWHRMQAVIQAESKPARQLSPRRWLPYAAAGLFLAIAGAWLMLSDKPGSRESHTAVVDDVAPGGNRALLTLPDGQTIDLRPDQAGIVMQADGIAYRDGRTTVSLPDGREPVLTSRPLILQTPKGGTYSITLPDGTDVWLNASSTLKYPSRFDGSSREVELVGEAYFDVAPDPARPFRVISASQSVEVLGTEFNISAYPDEMETKTTLVEGKVRLSLVPDGQTATARNALLLTPSEQAVVHGDTVTKSQVDVSRYVAWRDGLVVLDHADLAQVIRQLERWYDVEFVLQGPLPKGIHLSGKLPRNSNLSGIVHALHINTKMNFTIEGRRVMVSGN